MNNFAGGYNNDAQRQRMATQQACGTQQEEQRLQEYAGRTPAPKQGSKKQLIGTILGIGAVVLVLALKALNVI